MVRSVWPSLKTGRKWKVMDAIDDAEKNLKTKEMMGATQTRRQGLGTTNVQRWSKATGKVQRDLVIHEVRSEEERNRNLSHGTMCGTLWRLSFIIRATYNLLPLKTNKSPVQGKPQSMDHVLSSCKTALADSRYTWRHNRVLKELTSSIWDQMQCDTAKSKEALVTKEGKKWAGAKITGYEFVAGGNLLGCESSWKIAADIGEKRKNYPEFITKKGLRPGIALLSEQSAKVN
uniref:Uncharacterized protein n=1 Tax=Octopus bimaculoides TaxID=37653 RepID=A0A0L8HH18_OCTBM